MKIWKIDCLVDDYSIHNLVTQDDRIIIKEKLVNGGTISEWGKIEIKVCDHKVPTGDNPMLWMAPSVVMVSKKSKNTLNKYENKWIQFLPINDVLLKEEFYLLNIIDRGEYLNYDMSQFRYLLGDIRIEVEEYVFMDCVKDKPIFKIYLDGILQEETFVSDEFKQLIEDNKLRGFKFTEVFEFED